VKLGMNILQAEENVKENRERIPYSRALWVAASEELW